MRRAGLPLQRHADGRAHGRPDPALPGGGRERAVRRHRRGHDQRPGGGAAGSIAAGGGDARPRRPNSATEDAARRGARRAPDAATSAGVVVEGDPDVWVKLAKCCMPVPGDEILGFITRENGVSVHRADCTNVPP